MEQIALIVEVLVDEALGDASGPRDLRGSDRAELLLSEEQLQRFSDLDPAGRERLRSRNGSRFGYFCGMRHLSNTSSRSNM